MAPTECKLQFCKIAGFHGLPFANFLLKLLILVYMISVPLDLMRMGCLEIDERLTGKSVQVKLVYIQRLD